MNDDTGRPAADPPFLFVDTPAARAVAGQFTTKQTTALPRLFHAVDDHGLATEQQIADVLSVVPIDLSLAETCKLIGHAIVLGVVAYVEPDDPGDPRLLRLTILGQRAIRFGADA
jgi:hypothetical protein